MTDKIQITAYIPRDVWADVTRKMGDIKARGKKISWSILFLKKLDEAIKAVERGE